MNQQERDAAMDELAATRLALACARDERESALEIMETTKRRDEVIRDAEEAIGDADEAVRDAEEAIGDADEAVRDAVEAATHCSRLVAKLHEIEQRFPEFRYAMSVPKKGGG